MTKMWLKRSWAYEDDLFFPNVLGKRTCRISYINSFAYLKDKISLSEVSSASMLWSETLQDPDIRWVNHVDTSHLEAEAKLLLAKKTNPEDENTSTALAALGL